MKDKIFTLKVFQNKRNGQLTVNLPKRKLGSLPKEVKISVSEEYTKKPKRSRWTI